MVITRGDEERIRLAAQNDNMDHERLAAQAQFEQRQQELDRREQELIQRIADHEQRERDLAERIVVQNGIDHNPEENQNALQPPGNNVAAIGLVNMQPNGIDNHRSIKLPKLCANEPELWFVQIESIFTSHNINAKAEKTQALLANADGDSLNCVKHIIMANPPPADSYTQIKNGIIAHFSVSDESRVYQLLRGDVITSGKPSQILNRLRSLNSGNISEDVLKAIFLTKLPNQHQLVLASSGNVSLNDLAKKLTK
ncbi:uncharacterized protein LOC122505671 [Leptopilina heterotoma]|uniref:uncharacterized protein LOC122505671 n=1 Tax=Leptopilina heterotoma TaxID=63436 RepID=UPI001CA8C7EE|nr:uncharacterized protein LOC122505671 [Leptopilina heterotoma]